MQSDGQQHNILLSPSIYRIWRSCNARTNTTVVLRYCEAPRCNSETVNLWRNKGSAAGGRRLDPATDGAKFPSCRRWRERENFPGHWWRICQSPSRKDFGLTHFESQQFANEGLSSEAGLCLYSSRGRKGYSIAVTIWSTVHSQLSRAISDGERRLWYVCMYRHL